MIGQLGNGQPFAAHTAVTDGRFRITFNLYHLAVLHMSDDAASPMATSAHRFDFFNFAHRSLQPLSTSFKSTPEICLPNRQQIIPPVSPLPIRGLLFPVFQPDLLFQYLSLRILGQRLHELNGFGCLVVGDPVFAEANDVLLSCLGILL